MIGLVARKEFLELARDRRVLVLTIVLALLALVAAAMSSSEQSRYQSERAQAVEQDRRIWQGQGEVNPHSAAHFGMYAFRPRPPLAVFDPALLPWQGEAVWIEAHYQNPPQAREADSSQLVQRFGDLSPAWMLQVLLPLLIIVVGFGTLAGERESGTLKLQLGQGISARSIVFGKLAALGGGVIAVVALVIGVSALSAALISNDLPDLANRAGFLMLTYGAYGLLWAILTLAVSAFAHSARQSLVILLGLWAIGAVLAPRVSADIAARAHPTTSAGQFWSDVRTAQQQGIDGHNPSSDRVEKLKQEVLRRYGVAEAEDLPFDFAGVTLQAGEEYSNRVFDRFWGQASAREKAELRTQLWFSPLSPLIALRSLSAGLAGSDTVHQHAFTQAAEQHRRWVQLELNKAQAATGRGQNFKNKMPANFWRNISTFEYRLPHLLSAMGEYAIYAAILVAWLLSAFALLFVSIRRVERHG